MGRQLLQQRSKKREQERLRYLKEVEEKEMCIEEMKKKLNEKYKERKQMSIAETNCKRRRIKEKERENKKIRLKILMDGKEVAKKRDERIQSMHQDKLSAKEQKAIEL